MSVGEIQHLLASSHFQQAFEQAREGSKDASDSLTHRQTMIYLAALAAARGGAQRVARETLQPLLDAPPDDATLAAQTASLDGRLLKDELAGLTDPAAQRRVARRAGEAYLRASALSQDTYPLINAATLMLLAGDGTAAEELARQVLRRLETASTMDHWSWATVAEAQLLLGELDPARKAYLRAASLAGTRFGDLASMRRQLRILAGVCPGAEAMLDTIPSAGVMVFTGHMMDAPGRPQPRFPTALEPAVREQVARELGRLRPNIAYGQAASGSDLIACEVLLDRGAELHLVLPCSEEEFIARSVEPSGPAWRDRYEAVRRKAASLTLATDGPLLGDDCLYEFTSDLIQGLAVLRASSLDVTPVMLAIADAQQPGATGGTLATKASWTGRGLPVCEVDLAALRQAGPHPEGGHTAAVASPLPTEIKAPHPPLGRLVRFLLFADVSGFSRLSEEHHPTFFQTFLGLVPKVLKERALKALQVSTSGDGLYIVFADAHSAADFAWHLSKAVGQIDWTPMGLPSDTHLRTALHAGPVFQGVDPATGLVSHYGSHVTRAARVEPVVIPGQIGVTEPFAALLAAQAKPGYASEFAGTTRLAKSYGSSRLYRLRKLATLSEGNESS